MKQFHFANFSFFFFLFFYLFVQNCFTQTELKKESFIPADSLFTKGVQYFKEKNIDSTIHYLLLSLNNENYLDDNDKKQAYSYLMRSYRTIGENENTLVYGKKLLNTAQLLRDTAAMELSYFFSARAHESLGNNAEAMDCYKASIAAALSIKDYPSAAKSSNSIATYYNLLGEHEKALPYGKSALEYAEKSGDMFQIGSTLLQTAPIYYGLKEYDNCVNAYKKALECYRELKNEQYLKITEAALDWVLTQLGSSNVILEKAKKVDAKEILDTGMDSLAVPGSYQDIQLKLLTADVNVTDKSLKLEALQEDYYKKQATALKQRIWFISALSLLLVTLLILLYNRQRQKAKMEKITRLSEQRKNEYLLLQQDSEQKMIRKYVEGLETERERISKELHDGICNDLLALEMAFKNDISTKKEIQKHLDFLEKTRANIRHISHELMPPQFQYATIDEILKDYILQYNTTDKCLVKYYCDDDYNFANLSKELAFEIYRIVQETVGNAVKHAQASEIVLKLAKIDNEIQIFTSDNGKGFGKTKNYGYSISERVKSLNGSMDITSGEMGTSIKIAFNL